MIHKNKNSWKKKVLVLLKKLKKSQWSVFVHAVWLSYFVNPNNLATATKTTITVVEVFLFLFPGLKKNEVVQSYYIIILWMTNMDLVLCQFISDVQAQKQIVMIAMRTVFYRNLNRQPNLVCWQHYLYL